MCFVLREDFEVYFGCFVCSDMMLGVFWMCCVLKKDTRSILDVLCAQTLCEVCFGCVVCSDIV